MQGNQWLWSNGQNILFGWGGGQPDDPEEKCVHIWDVINYYLNNGICTDWIIPFICEIPGTYFFYQLQRRFLTYVPYFIIRQ